MKKGLLFILFIWFGLYSTAQIEISGRITDSNSGNSMPGATVSIRGTNTGTIADLDGKYSITARTENDVLIVSFLGYLTQNITIGSQRTINVALVQNITEIDDVVVTALGIKREKKALGYAVQDVSGDEVSETNPTNIVSALTGKIAGVEIITSSGQVGASSTIKIRGNKSFFGSTQPLFVVDGTPIMNGISSARDNTTATDFGNGAMDIDPANIESISVLKGASATALYGSRAADGVIMITTKKGASRKGIGVDFTTSVAFDNVYIMPNYQNEYGQGNNGSEYVWKNDATYGDSTYQAFHDAREFKWDLNGTGRHMNMDESWGSRLDVGLMVPQMDSPLDENGKVIPTPWISRPDNVKSFYETGVTYNNNVALTAGNEAATGRLTFSNVTQKGVSPNTDQVKTNLGLNTNFKINNKLSFDANINYAELSNDNLPQQGNSMRNPLLEFNSWFGRNVNMDYLKQHYDEIVLYNGEKWANNWVFWENQHPNPYWNAYKNTMSRERKRVFGNVALNYDIMEGVKLTTRFGTDFFNEHRKYIFHKYSRDWTPSYMDAVNGTFWEQYRLESESNADIMLQIDRDLNENFSITSIFGANYRQAYDQIAETTGLNLVVPDFFATSNFEGEPEVSFLKYKNVTQSAYGSVNIAFKRYLFTEFSYRQDWNSTLPEGNWSFPYPALNIGFIFTDALKIESPVLSYGKLRAGIAKVGDGTSAYQLSPVFYDQGATAFKGVNLFGVQASIPPYNLKPEMTSSKEFGLEMKFLDNRLGFDVTYYDAVTDNQILSVAVPYSSGFSSWTKNAGSIQNKGVEVQFYAAPVESKSGFNWDVNVNWSTNSNKVLELEGDMEALYIATMYSNYNMELYAFPGDEWGAIYGTTFKRNEDGDVLIGSNGIPRTTPDRDTLGYVNPDWIGGIRNTFSYKGFYLTALVDFRKGGDIFSVTKSVGQKAGILQSTVEGGIREDGMIADGVYEDGALVDLNGDGVKEDASGLPNQTVVSAKDYWSVSRDWGELAVVDGSFIKLREVMLSYRIPNSFTKKFLIQDATISAYSHNVALLYTHKSNDVHIDPEVSSGGTISGAATESYQLPPTRSIGFKLNFKF
ncbi:MAG: SusC/RagA family TonB-linked outer membrane protein [Bacteroidales bacterium]|nr:SusC/RagA family TonB-linked outer membrane protein [Bacteroidales bacterium]